MRIAVNTQHLLKNKLEGIGWFAHETLQRITQNNPQHEFVFIFDRPWDESFIYGENIIPAATRIPSRHPVLWYWHYEHDVPRILDRYKPDLFFSPDGWMSLRTKVPTVDVIHDVNFMHRAEDFPKLTKAYYQHYFPKFAQRAQQIITVSEYSKNDIASTFNVEKDKIHVCYNGCNPSYVPSEPEVQAEVRKRFSQGQPYFVYVGSLNPRKNIDGMFRAFDRFKDETQSNFKLVVVGEAMWRGTDLKSKVQALKHGADIVFTGRISSEVLQLVLSSAHALLLFSFFEGFGIPIVEAMNCDVPVICSNVSSMPEVAGDAALFVNPNSMESMVSALTQMESDSDLAKRLVEAGRKQRTHFSWDLTAQRVWNVLENQLKK